MLNWRKQCGKALTLQERTYLKETAALLAAVAPKLVIVNIGVFRCASMYCLRVGAPRARLIGIDIEPCDVPIDRGLHAEFLIGDSRKCHVEVTTPIDLLFIDGDHHYAVVKEDIKNWTPKVKSGGFVIFHDYNPLPKDLAKIPYLEGVKRAVNEWSRATVDWMKAPAPDSLAAFQRTS